MSVEPVTQPSQPVPIPVPAAQNTVLAEVRAAPLVVRCIHSLEALGPALRARMAELNLASRQADPFSTPEFFESYLRHDEFLSEGDQLQPWILTAFAGEQLVGYLALRRVRGRALGVSTPILEFLATHDVDRPHVVARPDHERACTEAFLEYLIDHGDQWTHAQLQQQGPASALFPLPELLTRRGYLVRTFPNMESCGLKMRWKSLAEYYRALSKHQRHNVSRSARKLLQAGALRYLSSSDPEVTPALLELYAAIEPRSWKASAYGTISRHQRRMAFFRELLSPGQPMRLRLDVLLLEGVPIAAMMVGRFGEALFGLQRVYDSAHQALGPGSTMMMLAMHQAIGAQVKRYNLLSGSAYYKSRWLADVEHTQAVQLFRPFTPYWFKARIGELKRRMKPLADPTAVDHNVDRRSVEAEGGPAREAEPAAPGELSRWSALADQAAQGTSWTLDNAQIAALMPFELNPKG